jgi:hypothetical protein
LLDRQVARFGALQDAIDKMGGSSKMLRRLVAVGKQRARLDIRGDVMDVR